MGLNLDALARFLKLSPDRSAALETVELMEERVSGAGRVVDHDPRLTVHHHMDGKSMAFANVIIVVVVPWSNFQRTSSKIALNVGICNDWNSAPNKGDHHILTNHVAVTLIVRVDTDRRVTKDSLRSGGGDWNVGPIGITTDKHVLEVIHGALFLDRIHLKVRDCSHEIGTPVDHVCTAVDETTLVKTNKCFCNSGAHIWIQCELFPSPVAARA
mmetsp:Transcript_4267/g.8351  ORF Transcript_4267/g.8351 Transcript_4267/m.8351 type:complete len:214 (-) Transcript_4267:670-1311(-)